MSSPPAFGIDLGTTNSAIAYTALDQVHMVPISEKETSIPSLFTLDDQGKPLIGEEARTQKNPAALVSASKRLIGRNFHRAEELQQLFTYDIIDGGEENALIPILDQVFTMEEISAAIIAHLCTIAQEHTSHEVTEAVLTVPTYFDEQQRSAIKKAGEMAGIKVLRILNEPTAAALAYGKKKNINKRIAVYDLGGGTFDVSVVDIKNGSFEVLASGGNPQLGGVDFDDRLLRFFLEHIYEEYGYDLAFDKGALHILRKTAEDCKIKLSTELSTDISLPLYVEEEEEEFLFTYTLTRPHLEELTLDLIKKTIETTLLILQELSYNPKDLDEVLLVGGQSLMPRIHIELQNTLGYPPSKNVHPKEVVAKGAALMARSLTTKNQSDLTLQDRLPQTIGVRKSDGTIAPIFENGTLLPAKAQRILPTVRDMQTSIVLHLYQGNDPLAQNNESIQVFIFSQLRPALKGQTKVETLFTLNEDGMLSVQARDKSTKRKVKIQALSVAQFEALKQTPLPSSSKASPLEHQKKEIKETEKQKKEPTLVDQDLMISRPFPAQVPIEEKQTLIEDKQIPIEEKDTPSKNRKKKEPPVKTIQGVDVQSESIVENKKIMIKNSSTISVPRTQSFFARCMRWFLSLIGRS